MTEYFKKNRFDKKNNYYSMNNRRSAAENNKAAGQSKDSSGTKTKSFRFKGRKNRSEEKKNVPVTSSVFKATGRNDILKREFKSTSREQTKHNNPEKKKNNFTSAAVKK